MMASPINILSIVVAVSIAFNVAQINASPHHFHSQLANEWVAKNVQFPFMASLFDIQMLAHVCSGAILTDHHIISAASCYPYYELYPRSLSASIGSDKMIEDANIKSISTICIHPEFEESSNRNDLAILKTLEQIEFTERIQPLNLPLADIDRKGCDSFMICGFTMVS